MHVSGIKTHVHTGRPPKRSRLSKKASLSFDLLFDALLFQSGNDSLALLKTSASSLLCCSLTRTSHQYSCLFCDDGKGASYSDNPNHRNANRKNLTWQGRRKSNTVRVRGDLNGGVTWENINMCHLATQLSRDARLNSVPFAWISQGILNMYNIWSNYFDCCVMKDSHADLRWDSWECSVHPSNSPPASLPTVHFPHRHHCQCCPWMSRASPPWDPSHTGWHAGFCRAIWEKYNIHTVRGGCHVFIENINTENLSKNVMYSNVNFVKIFVYISFLLV